MSCFIEMQNIEKTFPNGVRALKGANLTVKKGEIKALVGENAAGKSTLMNILYGSLKADRGTIRVNGKQENINHPADAISLGIGMVHQHFKLVPNFTILENIILGQESRYTNRLNKIDYDRARRDVQEILDRTHVDLDLDRCTDTVSIGLQSKIEIIKTLFKGANLIILDEPTTVLAPNEVDAFFDFLRVLRDQGCTMIYISHRMKEIFDLTDSITVLRNGNDIDRIDTKTASMETVTSLMLGYEPKIFNYDVSRRNKVVGNKVLELKGISVKNSHVQLADLSLTVNKGEILGIAGIEGNGQVELADMLIGVLDNQEGEILLNGEDVSKYTAKERRSKGLSYVPDDRIRKGLALNASITENAIIGHENSDIIAQHKHLVDWKKAREFTEKIIKEYKVEGISDPDQKICGLSGGNMQKVILGREMITQPDMVVLAQPTAGVDFNAQRKIHEIIIELQQKGMSFLLISEDLDELMNLSDRILIMYRGQIVKEYISREQYDDKEIGLYMTGVKTDEA